MPKKETSEAVSELASKYLNYSVESIRKELGAAMIDGRAMGFIQDFLADVKTLAASCLSQDETPAQS